MNDDKPMPPQPPTKQLPAMTDRALLEDLRSTVKEGFAAQNQVIAEMSTSVDMLIGQGKTFAKWRGEVDSWRTEVDERLKTKSIQVRDESKINLKQEAVIANLITEVATVKDNQVTAAKERAETAAMVKEVRDTVVGIATNKKVLFVGKVIFFVAVAYSGLHGLKVVP